MSEDGWDVNVEYENLFGSAKRVNLFDSEKEYDELRHYIIAQPLETDITKDLPFEGIVLPIVEKKPRIEECKKTLISTILTSLQNKHKADLCCQSITTPVAPDKHLFFIKEDGACDAKGYYDEKKSFFFICKDSLVSYDTDLFYQVNDTEKARETFLNKVCKEEKGFYKVVRDAKCRSASAAAGYVLGYMADQTRWIDSEGKNLLDVYPDVFSKTLQMEKPRTKINKLSKEAELSLKTKEQPQKKLSDKVQEPPKVKEPKQTTKLAKVGRPPRYYYIIRENMGIRSCNAKGMFDKINDKFIILEGSKLARDVTSSYRFTASDIKRNKFIKLNCSITRYELIMKRDAICNSPDEAACFVLGENSNGWVEWKSKDGVSLETYINKV